MSDLTYPPSDKQYHLAILMVITVIVILMVIIMILTMAVLIISIRILIMVIYVFVIVNNSHTIRNTYGSICRSVTRCDRQRVSSDKK